MCGSVCSVLVSLCILFVVVTGLNVWVCVLSVGIIVYSVRCSDGTECVGLCAQCWYHCVFCSL